MVQLYGCNNLAIRFLWSAVQFWPNVPHSFRSNHPFSFFFKMHMNLSHAVPNFFSFLASHICLNLHESGQPKAATAAEKFGTKQHRKAKLQSGKQRRGKQKRGRGNLVMIPLRYDWFIISASTNLCVLRKLPPQSQEATQNVAVIQHE